MATQGVSNVKVETCLRKLLKRDGYEINPRRKNGENGADIIADRHGGTWHIEVIGYKKKGFQRSWDFNTAFFGAVSRLDEGAKHCVIALARQAESGLPTRAKRREEAWKRISQVFPELEIWLVDTENERYEPTMWGDWLR